MERIRKNDFVQVIAGKDKGKTGRVVEVLPVEKACIVEGVRVVKKHQKASKKGGPGGISEKNLKVDWSNLMHFDPKLRKPTRVRIVEKDGVKYRQYIKSGEFVQQGSEEAAS